MLVGAALLATAIAWIARAAGRVEIERAVEDRIAGPPGPGWRCCRRSVLREGIELTIFLAAARVGSGAGALAGALLGFAAAIVLGVLVYAAATRVRLRVFFAVTNVLLVLFAAGLVAHGLHEFVEVGVLPPIVEHVWDVNPLARADGSLPALHENGAIGGILKGLFGWNGNPSRSS